MTLCTHDPCRGSRSASICQSVCQSMCQYVCQSMCQMTHVLECIYVSIYVSNDSCLYVSIYVADDSCLYVSIYMSKDISLQARTQESCTRLDVYVSIGMHTSGCLCRVNAHVWMTITRQAYIRLDAYRVNTSGCLWSQHIYMAITRWLRCVAVCCSQHSYMAITRQASRRSIQSTPSLCQSSQVLGTLVQSGWRQADMHMLCGNAAHLLW